MFLNIQNTLINSKYIKYVKCEGKTLIKSQLKDSYIVFEYSSEKERDTAYSNIVVTLMKEMN